MYLLLLPNLYLLYFNANLQLFAMSLLLWLYVCAIFKSTKHLYLLLPFLALLPAYLYFIHLYQVAISEQMLSIIVETNFQEAWNFLGSYAIWYVFATLLWLIFLLWLCYKNYQRPYVWSHRSRYWVLIVVSLYLASCYWFSAQVERPSTSSTKNDGNFMVDDSDVFLHDLKQTYPFGLFVASFDMFKEQKKINQAFDRNKNFRFKATQTSKTDAPEVYVLVIGETSRRENWQLNGYRRATNPQLSQQDNLVNFSNMLSLVSATRSSIPMILTRKPEKQVYNYVFAERSVISAFKEAGFKTYWLSTQQKFGAFDTTSSVYAKEADEMIFLNKTNYNQAGEFDDVLLPALEKVLAAPDQKKFIVLHTLGSHYNYQHRYPAQFEQFQPSLKDLKHYSLHNPANKQQLINSYDNSILFTDHVLNQVIEQLKQHQQTRSFLLYSSDHGEDLFDQGCEQSGHGLVTRRNVEIASFAWYSQRFAEQSLAKTNDLQQNKHRKINHTAIFPTLLDAANIQLPDDALQRSVLKPFQDYPRMVFATYNYDQTPAMGVCQEIK